ncbi:MAG: IMP cyclohydrolase [Lentisphaeria bacterium]|nr:IMP cyclohydrolase [Lentisphaeria bacterium]NQZ67391.1 IMP cyclohydrolase [Lentisphaeria bacterium]
MYVGRIVSVGKNKAGQLCVMYRVSSNSFPNREARVMENAVAIMPKAGFEDDINKSPYIAYNCARLCGDIAILSNGTQTDHLANKIDAGQSMMDATTLVLHGMDYEHDHLNTPRISAMVDRKTGKGVLGIVRHDALLVKEFELEAGQAFYVATYNHNSPGDYVDSDFDVADAAEACEYIIGKGVFADLERPITAACAVDKGDEWDVAIMDAPPAE